MIWVFELARQTPWSNIVFERVVGSFGRLYVTVKRPEHQTQASFWAGVCEKVLSKLREQFDDVVMDIIYAYVQG